jgi:aconitate hydratase
MNTQYRKPLTGTSLDYFDARSAVEAVSPGAWSGLPYTSRVLAENLVRRCEPATLDASLRQLIERRATSTSRGSRHAWCATTSSARPRWWTWPACATRSPSKAATRRVNPVVPVQLIVDHSLAVECGGYDPEAFAKNRAIEDRRNEDRFHFIDWTAKRSATWT